MIAAHRRFNDLQASLTSNKAKLAIMLEKGNNNPNSASLSSSPLKTSTSVVNSLSPLPTTNSGGVLNDSSNDVQLTLPSELVNRQNELLGIIHDLQNERGKLQLQVDELQLRERLAGGE